MLSLVTTVWNNKMELLLKKKEKSWEKNSTSDSDIISMVRFIPATRSELGISWQRMKMKE